MNFVSAFVRTLLLWEPCCCDNAQVAWFLFLPQSRLGESISKMASVSTSHLMRGITHQQRVTRLYRNSLKHLLSWCIGREGWRKEAVGLRARFDALKHETDRRLIDAVLDDAEAEFDRKKHPYPYINPTAPDGSKWERNIPPPPHVVQMLPQEEQWHKEMVDYANYKID